MDERLKALLEYESVLGALASTSDGLVVAAAGFSMSDAEVVAAAGAALLSAVEASGERGGSMAVAGGTIHMLRGSEVSLVLLTEESVEFDDVVELMDETLQSVSGVLY